jgi:tetratricopeptide (TPR) repeat protein
MALLIAAVVLLCFLPALRYGFVGYDDPDYITNNPIVYYGLSWRLAGWAFTSAHDSNWHPLTWLSHAADCSLFGLSPWGHHLTSILLHAANAALLFVFLAGATGLRWSSAFVALAFGLHPLHVESAVWVAERKDVLCGFFTLLTLLAYKRYAARHAVSRYLFVVGLFVLALLAKPMAVTLPVLLLALDRWPLARAEPFRRCVLEKLPMLALSLCTAAATVWAQAAGGSVAPLDALPIGLRLQNAAYSYLVYLGKTFWPLHLAVFYPFPFSGIAWWKVSAAAAVITAFSAVAWVLRRSHPWLAFGFIWYIVSLVPVIGVVQVGMQAMADRYMYVPMIGLLIALAWELGRLPLARFAAPMALAALALLTWRQIPYWRDGVSLWTHALEVTHDNFVAHDNLGVELDRASRPEEALAQYRQALRIRPWDRNARSNYAEAIFARGAHLFAAGRRIDALAAFREGMRYSPWEIQAHDYAANILNDLGQSDAARTEFRLSGGAAFDLARIYLDNGVALARAGRLNEAERAFEESISTDASNVEVFYNLGLIEAAQGKRAEAIAAMQGALRLDPSYTPARTALADLGGRE